MLKKLALGASVIALSACGGGGGDTPTPPPPVATPAPAPTPPPPPPPPPTATCASAPSGTERWPAYNPGTRYADIVDRAIRQYREGRYDWRIYYLPAGYVANGPYVTISPFDRIGTDTRFDDLGVPQVLVNGNWEYNPVTISNYALWHFTLYTRGVPLPSAFWAAVGKLQSMVGDDGAVRYTYPFDGQPPGWVSAMAQGEVLSVFARAYQVSGDPSLITQGNDVLRFMLTRHEQGGTLGDMSDLDPSLSQYVSLYEYSQEVSAHTLNGFLFAMFGLYDWARLGIPGNQEAEQLAQTYFDCSVHTVASTIHYYDIGGFSAYDMDHVISDLEPGAGPVYHRIHIAQLVSLYSIAPRPEFLHWARQWARSDQPIP